MKSIKIIFAIFVLSLGTISCVPEALPENNDIPLTTQANTGDEEIPVDDKEKGN